MSRDRARELRRNMAGASHTPPPQVPPSGGEEVVIDDRRRFKELWKELLLARTAAAFAAGALAKATVIGLIALKPGVNILSCLVIVVDALAAALPTAVAKRGYRVFPIAAIAVGLGYTFHYAIPDSVVADISFRQTVTVIVIVPFTALGVVEGLLERSIATTLAGMLGGAIAGATHMAILWPGPKNPFVGMAVMSMHLHLSIGLSLALGRWIRDLPRRRPVTIREMRDGDVPEASQLVSECYRLLAGELGFSAEELAGLLGQCSSVGAIRAQLSRCACFVAESGGALVGYAAVDGNEISEFFVRPGFQRRGIGSRLYDTVETTIRSAGHETLTVGTASSAEGFYEKMGARVVQRKEIDRGPLKGRSTTILEKKV